MTFLTSSVIINVVKHVLPPWCSLAQDSCKQRESRTNTVLIVCNLIVNAVHEVWKCDRDMCTQRTVPRLTSTILGTVVRTGYQRLSGWALVTLADECDKFLVSLVRKNMLLMLRGQFRTLEELPIEKRLNTISAYTQLVNRGGYTFASVPFLDLVTHLLYAIDLAFAPENMTNDIYMSTLNQLLCSDELAVKWRSMWRSLVISHGVDCEETDVKVHNFRRLCCLLMNVRLGDLLRNCNAASIQNAGVLRAMLKKGDTEITRK
jgi:hypothetical protein